MIVYCTKREKKTIADAERLNGTIAKLQKDLTAKGIRFDKKDWRDLVSGNVTDFREFVYLKWAHMNPVESNLWAFVEYKNGSSVYCAAPKVLDNSGEYEAAFNGQQYDAVFEFEYNREGVPSVNIAKLRSVASGLFTVFVENLTAEDLEETKAKCLELTKRMQGGEAIGAKRMEPGFRIAPDPTTNGQMVVFDPKEYYRDMARLYIDIREGMNL